jgi:hypothetical protein
MEYFLGHQFESDLNISSPSNGKVALAFAQLITKMNKAKQSSVAYVSPAEFQAAVNILLLNILSLLFTIKAIFISVKAFYAPSS